MTDSRGSLRSAPSLSDVFLLLASLVIIFAGARYASSLLVPLLLAVFIAIICASPISSLKKRGLPGWLASVLVGLFALLLLLLMGALLSRTGGAFLNELPGYQQQFQLLMANWLSWFAGQGLEFDTKAVSGMLNPATALGFFGSFLSGLGDVLANFVLILFTVVFILADAPTFPSKMAGGESHGYHRYLVAFQDLVQAMNSYIVTKALVSLLTGGLIWLGLALLDVKFAVLWAFLAFLLNFVPNIGSTVAAVPAVLLSLLDMNPLLTGSIITLYLVVNTLVGNFIEPRWMGQRVGLSTLAVFLSLVFWGWMFGPVGMFLSVPLTMTLKFLAMQNSSTTWISVLLANESGGMALVDEAIAVDSDRASSQGEEV